MRLPSNVNEDSTDDLEIALAAARVWGIDGVRHEAGASRILLADEHALAAFPESLASDEHRISTGPYAVYVPDEDLPNVMSVLRRRSSGG